MDAPRAVSTLAAQREVELSLLGFLRRTSPEVYALWCHHPEYNGIAEAAPDSFLRRKHTQYVERKLENLSARSQGLYPAQPWLVYWALQAADVLGVTAELYANTPADAIARFIKMCLSEDRIEDASGAEVAALPRIGFAGGTSEQLPHLVSSYAACAALCVLGESAHLEDLPRAAIKRWLLSLRLPNGSFQVHIGGEADIRASYCAAVLVALLQLDDPATFPLHDANAADVRATPVLTHETAAFVASCQTHEGGFTCSRHASEAHGAYTQCGLAALLLMGEPHLVCYPPLRRWLAARQLAFEGGFNGRTNKLVDSCYSHWIGASHALLMVSEAHMKLTGTGRAARRARDTSETEVHCLRAVEAMLLDHAQLLDATALSCVDAEAWDRAEARHLFHKDLAESFLNLEEPSVQHAADLRQTRRRLLRQLDSVKSSEESTAAADECSAAEAFVAADVGELLFNQRKLQTYVLRCCQEPVEGGLMDKPGCPNDTYHTCYALSGVSTAQNLEHLTHAKEETPYLATARAKGYVPGVKGAQALRAYPNEAASFGVVLGLIGPSAAADVSLLRSTNPVVNLHRNRVQSALGTWGFKKFF